MQRAGLAAAIKFLLLGAAIYPVAHIGDEASDLGRSIELLERPANGFHDLVIIPHEPVVKGMELIDGHVLRLYDDRVPGVFRIIDADDPAFLFKFPLEFGPRIRDENIHGDAVDIEFLFMWHHRREEFLRTF